MYRKVKSFAIIFAGLALTMGGFARANAAEIILVRARYYAPAVVALPAPVVALPQPVYVADADDRFVRSHDIQGVVTYFDRFNMNVRIDGVVYPVQLHQGTVILPTGTTLAPTMVVNAEGCWSSGTFYANRIAVVRF